MYEVRYLADGVYTFLACESGLAHWWASPFPLFPDYVHGWSSPGMLIESIDGLEFV